MQQPSTVVGLISEGDESAYRKEVEQLTGGCRENNLNTTKMKELIVDFWRKKTESIQPLCIRRNNVERVSDFRFLGLQMEEDLSWSANTSETTKKAQQRICFVRLLRKNHLSKKLFVSFYCCSIESVLTYCMCVWYASCTAADRKHSRGSLPLPRISLAAPSPP